MRKTAIATCLALAVSAGHAADVRTIIIDEAHNDVVLHDGAAARTYVIAPADTLRIDARKFDFHRAGYPNLLPNAVRLIVKDAQYFAAWSPSGVMPLSVETLVPLNNGGRFEGFRAGDVVTLEIGIKEVDEAKRQISFKVQWAATVKVRRP